MSRVTEGICSAKAMRKPREGRAGIAQENSGVMLRRMRSALLCGSPRILPREFLGRSSQQIATVERLLGLGLFVVPIPQLAFFGRLRASCGLHSYATLRLPPGGDWKIRLYRSGVSCPVLLAGDGATVNQPALLHFRFHFRFRFGRMAFQFDQN